MKRFLQVATLLVICLFVLVSGVDATLDHVTRTPAQNSFTWYNEKGNTVLAYNGDLASCQAYTHPAPGMSPTFLHRTGTSELTPNSPRWF